MGLKPNFRDFNPRYPGWDRGKQSICPLVSHSGPMQLQWFEPTFRDTRERQRQTECDRVQNLSRKEKGTGGLEADSPVIMMLNQRFRHCSLGTISLTCLLPTLPLCYENTRGSIWGATECYQYWGSWVPQDRIWEEIPEKLPYRFY